MTSIELSIEEMRARRGVKWRRFPTDVLPAWVADMDFAVPDEVQEAVEQVVRLRDYGYGSGHGVREGAEGLAEAFQHYAKTSFGWDVDPAGVQQALGGSPLTGTCIDVLAGRCRRLDPDERRLRIPSGRGQRFRVRHEQLTTLVGVRQFDGQREELRRAEERERSERLLGGSSRVEAAEDALRLR